ncbi:MAG: hypothetical protein JWO06_936 [Bacteroidota bacterium]|nr:hypothetical protein [Bacteroidota bacterium]
MSKQIHISIPEPCQQSWSEMTATSQGAYCQSCKKNVIDFSNKTDNDIYEILTNAKGHSCGRFTPAQIHQPITKSEINNSFLNWKAIAASVATLIAAENLKAGDKDNAKLPADTIQKMELNHLNSLQVTDNSKASNTVIKGKVVDRESSEALGGAIIRLKHSDRTYVTNDEGFFAIDCQNLKSDTVSFSYIGYQTATMPVSQFTSCPEDSKIRLEGTIIGLEGVKVEELMMVGDISVRKGHRVKWAFQRLFTKIKYAFSKKD